MAVSFIVLVTVKGVAVSREGDAFSLLFSTPSCSARFLPPDSVLLKEDKSHESLFRCVLAFVYVKKKKKLIPSQRKKERK